MSIKTTPGEGLLKDQDKTMLRRTSATMYGEQSSDGQDITTNDNQSSDAMAFSLSNHININYRRQSITNSSQSRWNMKNKHHKRLTMNHLSSNHTKTSIMDDKHSFNDDQSDHKQQFPQHRYQRRKRARTWTQLPKKDVMTTFMEKNFSEFASETQTNNQLKKADKDDLLKRCRILYDRANSLINNKNERETTMSSFCECLNIIYSLYNAPIHLNEIEKSSIIGQHMNIILNLGSLYTDSNKLGKALKMYNEAQILYDCDKYGFKANINLKSYILRGMADVYIKQKEYLTALGLLEEALQSVQLRKDTLSEYQILCTKGRALFDAEQLENASVVFEEAIALLSAVCSSKPKPYDLYDRDLYRNTALCYKRLAHTFCSVVYINSTKTYAIKNTEKSMQYWNKSATCYHETVKICKRLYGMEGGEYVQSLYEWSDVLSTKGDYNKSWNIYQNIQSLFQQLDDETQKQYGEIISKTKQMIQRLRPYINDNTL